MLVRTSYYDSYTNSFFDSRVFTSVSAAVNFIENILKNHQSCIGIITYYINWRDSGTEHEIRYDLTMNGWEKNFEC